MYGLSCTLTSDFELYLHVTYFVWFVVFVCLNKKGSEIKLLWCVQRETTQLHLLSASSKKRFTKVIQTVNANCIDKEH